MSQQNSFQDLSWGAFDHASHAPQLGFVTSTCMHVILLWEIQRLLWGYYIKIVTGIVATDDCPTLNRSTMIKIMLPIVLLWNHIIFEECFPFIRLVALIHVRDVWDGAAVSSLAYNSTWSKLSNQWPIRIVWSSPQHGPHHGYLSIIKHSYKWPLLLRNQVTSRVISCILKTSCEAMLTCIQ